MAVSTGAPRTAATFPPIPLHRRIYGFGSIYGKTIRDSRLSFIIAAGLLGGMALVMGVAVSSIFPTPEARHELDNLFGGIPSAMLRLFANTDLMGDKVGTLGGYITFKYGLIFALGTALWSIFALSGTLAGEARRGSLDFVAVSPFGKRRIAVEKVAAHLTLLVLVMAIMAIALTASSDLYGDASLGDHIPLLSSVGFALWVGTLALFFGGLALALSPVLGRAGSAGIAALAMAVLWIINGLEVGGPLLLLSPFYWTFDHIPLVGIYDWPAVALQGILGVAFLVVGVELFARRDLGVTAGLSLPGLPAGVVGVRGPLSRAFGEQLPRALSWGIGLGLVGIVFTSFAASLADQIGSVTSLQDTFAKIFPGIDFGSAGGWLQLYAELLYIAAGFGAATFVAKWASDETEGRLETVLTTPVARARWVLSGGASALLAVVILTILFAAGIGVGGLAGGLDTHQAIVGSVALGLFAWAVIGIGVAVGGLWRTSLAAEIAAVFVVVTYLIDLIAPPLGLPDWFHQLALISHLGQPMIGQWDPVGIVACLVLAVGGIALGAWGMTRRDVNG
jgi:polyether ionophore transport system permease protein